MGRNISPHSSSTRSPGNVTSTPSSHPVYNTSHTQGSIIYHSLKTKFPSSVDQRLHTEEARELQPENLLKVRQVQKESGGHHVWKMVITIASAVTVLFAMCMFFLCCCRRKKKSNEEDETDRKNLIDSRDSPPLKTKNADQKEIEEAENEEPTTEKKSNDNKNKMEDESK